MDLTPFDDWSTDKGKEWLTEQDVEFGDRTPRGKLIQMAHEKAGQPGF